MPPSTPKKKAKPRQAKQPDPTLVPIPRDTSLALPIKKGTLVRIVRSPAANTRPDFVETRWNAIKDDIGSLPEGWGVNVVAYPTYRSAESIMRTRTPLKNRRRAASSSSMATPITDRATYQSWLEFTHEQSALEMIVRYKIARKTGLLIRRQYNRGGRRFNIRSSDLPTPHPFRPVTPDELAFIPPAVLRMMEKIAAVVNVPLTPAAKETTRPAD